MDAMCRTVCGENHQSQCVQERSKWEAEFENKGLKRLARPSFRAMADSGRLSELKPLLTSLYDAQSQVVHGKTLQFDDGYSFPTDARTVNLHIEITGKLMLSYVSQQ